MTTTSVLITIDHPSSQELATLLGMRVPTPADIHTLHLDEEKTSIGIQEVHTWLSELTFHPYGESQWGVIEEAHRLTPDAQQSLLKVLEEPPEHTQFILASSRPLTLLPTIRSRTRTIDVRTDDSTESDLLPLLESLQTASISVCLTLAESQGKTREDAKRCVEGLLKLTREKLLHAGSTTTTAQALLIARDQLEHNVNTRLVLEHAFFIIAGVIPTD